MKILYVTNAFPLPGQPGGLRYYKNMEWIQKQGHDVTVLCNARDHWTDNIKFTGTLAKPEKINGLNIIALPTPSGRRRSKLHRVLGYLALGFQVWLKGRKLNNIDIIIAGTPPLLSPLACLWLAKKFQARSILEIRDLHPQMAIASGNITHPFIVKPWRVFETGLRKRYDHIVANVPKMKTMVIEEGVAAKNITVITSGYDPKDDVTDQMPDNLVRYFSENSEKCIIGYTGNMGRGAWNIVGMVEAAKYLEQRTDIALLFVGDGEQRKDCEDYVQQYGLKNCTFFPPVKNDVVASVIQHCNAMVAVYHDNPFYEYILPLKLYDYMGAGCPVIFSGVGDGPELLDKSGGGITMELFDVRQLSEAMIFIADNPDQAKAMGLANKDYAERYLKRDIQLRKWSKVLEKS